MSQTERRTIWAALAVCVLLGSAVPLAANLPLLDPDEGIHAAIALEMVEQGDWRHPTLQGEPFLDKPALFSTAQAASLSLFGKHEWAVRLPGVLCHLLSAAATGWLAHRLFGRGRGPLAALAFLSLGAPAALSLAPVHDAAGVPFLLLWAVCLWEADRTSSGRVRIALTAAGAACVGGAFLAKGLIGVATVSVGYVSFRLWSSRGDLRGTVRAEVRFAAALLGGAALAAPWFLSMDAFAAAHGAPGYLRYYFLERHFGGYLSATQTHGSAPWWYYLPLLTVATWPWGPYAALGAISRFGGRPRPVRDGRANGGDGAAAWLVCWYVGGALFLSAAGSKLVTYSEPLYPALAALAADGCVRLLKETRSGRCRAALLALMYAGTAVGAVFATVALAEIGAVAGAEPSLVGIVAASGVSAAGLLAWQLLGGGRRIEALAVGATMTCGFLAAVVAGPLATVAPRYSQRDVARAIAAESPDGPVVLAGERLASLAFYPPPAVRAGLRTVKQDGPAPAVVVLAEKDAAALRRPDGPHVRTVGPYRTLTGPAARDWLAGWRRRFLPDPPSQGKDAAR